MPMAWCYVTKAIDEKQGQPNLDGTHSLTQSSSHPFGNEIQNDLTEYFSLLNFANPNYLGHKMIS